MPTFIKESRFPVSAEKLFGFHEAPDAFERLQPPWQTTQIIRPPTSLEVGTVVELRVKVGPLWQRIVAEHVKYEPGRMFADRMIEGPFAEWYHEHIVTPVEHPDGRPESALTDRVTYTLPLGAVGAMFGGWFARQQLEKLFEFRHAATLQAVQAD